MNNERQHFVPRTYLKNFCIKSTTDLFKTKFINQKSTWSNPLLSNINSICYDFDFYDIHENAAKENQVPQDFIEKSIFWYEKDFISNLISQIEQEEVHESTLSKIPEFYLSMTSRNPVFRNSFDMKQIEKIFDQAVPNMQRKFPFLEKEIIEKIVDRLRQEYLAKNGQDKLHNISLLKQYQGKSDIHKTLTNKLKGYKIEILQIRDHENLFICSDSPGFSRDLNGNIYSLKFQDDISHYVPITSKIAIGIHHPVYHFQKLKFQISTCHSEYVEFINKGTAIGRKEYLFCENKQYLVSCTKKLITN
nr:DUF4238 domain-containing protein [uncultured Fluviicola sp.]